jgi:hypothetical protein
MRNNKLNQNDDSTPCRFNMIAAKRRRGQPDDDPQTGKQKS